MSEDFSISEAANALMALETGEPQAPVDKAEETSDDADTEQGSASDDAPQEVGDEGDHETEGEEPQEPEQVEAVEPPANWTQEAKEAFKGAPPEIQKIIREQTALQDAEITRQQMQSAELRKSFERVEETAAAIEGWVTHSQDVFDAKWKGVTQEDWDHLAYSNPEQHAALKREYLTEKNAIEAVQQERERIVSEAKSVWINEQANILKRDLPELQKPENLKQLVEFSKSLGVTDAQLGEFDATAFKILWGYKQLQAEVKALKSGKPAQSNRPKPSMTTAVSGKPKSVRDQFAKDGSIASLTKLLMS